MSEPEAEVGDTQIELNVRLDPDKVLRALGTAF